MQTTSANVAAPVKLQSQQAKLDTSQQPKVLQGRLEVMSKAKSGDKLPLNLLHAQTSVTENGTAQKAKKIEARATDFNAIDSAQFSEKDFIGNWGGDLIITTRNIYATDVPRANLQVGDKGPTLVRINPLAGSVKVQPATVFFFKQEFTGPEVKEIGDDPSPFEWFLSKIFGKNNIQNQRFIVLGGGALKMHDGLGNIYRQAVLHDSVKMIGKNSIEADFVSARSDSSGKVVEYEERVVRLFKNGKSVYAKLAFAKYNADRVLERQTLLDGWLSRNSSAPAQITGITQKSWQDTVDTYGL